MKMALPIGGAIFGKGGVELRKVMWFTIGFVTACAAGVYFWGSWLCWLFVAAALIFVGSLLGMHWIRNLRILAAASLGLAIGLGWFAAFDDLFLSFPKEIDGQIANASMTIADYSVETEYGLRADTEMYLDGRVYKIRVYFNDLDEKVTFQPGDRVFGTFRFRMTLRGGAENPTYHSGDGIYLLAYQKGEVTVESCESMPRRYLPVTWRKSILDRIDQIFPEDTAAFASALLLGERSGIDYETNTAFMTSGISHIIAVSGLHISVIIALLWFFLGKHTHWPTIVGIPLLLIFAAVVGFTPSVTRACIMQIIMLIGWSLYVEYDAPTSLSVAVLIMLAANPMTLISVSFQLSVCCIIGMILFTKRIHDWLLSPKVLGSGKGRSFKRKLKRSFVSTVSVSLSANILTFPLVAYHFGVVSLVGMITNLAILWAVSLIFYGILFSCAFSFLFAHLGTWIASGTSVLIRFVVGTAKLLAGIPYAAVYTQSKAISVWIIFCYLCLAAFLLWKKRRVVVLCGAVIISLVIAIFVSWYIPAKDKFSVTVLNVGQGQSIVLRSGSETYLVDCGGDTNETAADVAAEYLLSQGIFRLDGVGLTHYDSDHYGGVPLLLSRVEAAALYMPVPYNEDTLVADDIDKHVDCPIVYVENDLELVNDGANVHLFAPQEKTSGNERSICVLFQTENCDILITGDRNMIGERFLLEHAEIPDVEVLIAGHHGSKYSTSEELLNQTKPEYVFVSAGRDNPYGHPSKELLERLADYDCQVYCTADMGNIVFRGR